MSATQPKPKATEVDDVSASLPLLMNTNNVVIVGQIGAGKSTLFNQLTGCAVETGGPISLTRKAQFALLGNSSNIMVIDTPGLGSLLNEVDHKRVLLSILELVPTNLIIFCVQCGNRAEEAATLCLKFWPAMHNHQDRVIFWISATGKLDNNSLSDWSTAFKATMKLGDSTKIRYSSCQFHL